ncbi:MAG: glycosyltransferase [Candidatus Omnitrophica bacterium]|nr:glycosyltransferase [Candidatus Omnitrophota bacterium]
MANHGTEEKKIVFITAEDFFGLKSVSRFIEGFLKYAPEDFSIDIIGLTSDKIKRPVNKWISFSLYNKQFRFLPVYYKANEEVDNAIELLIFSLKVYFHCRYNCRVILFFQRLGPALLSCLQPGHKLIVIHSEMARVLSQIKNKVRFLGFFPLFYLMCERITFRRMNCIYIVHNASVDYYKNRHPSQARKFLFLPTFYDKSIFYPFFEEKIAIRKRLPDIFHAVSPEKKWILFVGQLIPQKDPFLLIETFQKIIHRGVDAVMLIVGVGKLRMKTECYAKKLGVGNLTVFLGFFPHQMMPLVYNAADVLLLTSRIEGCPFVVLEALGCGIPVVATNVGEIKRFVHNGFSGEVVDSFDPSVIADAVVAVLEKPETYSRGNCTLSVIEYSPDKIFHPVYKICRELT